ncbi:MAG: imidazoleglycerol-phosphate dehydratase HisB [Nitrososphaerota archaeon]|jgi:imidazoleglycerol-phosphate dehydratase|uniref:imidazoleglycerol-phosphate dehydratase HisB n=1 Tax=Candidatus Bathycorpusculum sp. TaxID=2994959 RepID=UPI00283969B5|nr:imidazoleglycerol-phosphate dehydratase HisB [Candidatus Termiticorpusculum sp.]MCL2256814.1 imidazoleglycerol-phosphate dehydratase HisB [Candidatus Termiticorpusculum sp.]MCL2293107.1 imidazoleglycerol-phosphate dehydratase HisB [Candidatus Termiticorpusculum sp.]MDR0460850.1 imidazoleglycerol-phosphate dehydratase HisB [Nitrososphaerota archaeon]
MEGLIVRVEEVYRKTKETVVKVKVNLDGEGKAIVNSGVPFLDHMLTSFATHSLIDIEASVKGDLVHHCVEDLAIGLGEALNKALGSRVGITRFGNATVPMDCSIASVAVDLAMRPFFKIDLKFRGRKVEEMQTEDINHFYESLTTSLQANVHMFVMYGSNDHHKAEAATKALALSLRQAITVDSRRKGVPSSKGVI